MTAEEAEEKFEKRDKILNYFSVMMNKKRKDDESGENSIDSKNKMKKGFKVSDMDEWQEVDSDNDNDLEDRSDDDIKPNIKKEKKGLKKKKVTKKKKKGSDDDDDDSEPLEESDEGDFDDKEVDYMSDSSESSEESENEKTNRALKGVEDEDALRQLVLSDDDEEDEEKEDSEKADKDGEKSQNGDKTSDKKGKGKSDKLTGNSFDFLIFERNLFLN